MPLFKKGGESEDRKNILPTFDKAKLKGSLKCLTWIKTKIQKRGAIFPICMILLNAIYLTIGGAIFMAIERQPMPVVNTSQELVQLFDILKVWESKRNYLFSTDVNLYVYITDLVRYIHKTPQVHKKPIRNSPLPPSCLAMCSKILRCTCLYTLYCIVIYYWRSWWTFAKISVPNLPMRLAIVLY